MVWRRALQSRALVRINVCRMGDVTWRGHLQYFKSPDASFYVLHFEAMELQHLAQALVEESIWIDSFRSPATICYKYEGSGAHTREI